MGRRGKTPTPTLMLAARGNPHACLRLKNGKEPQPPTGEPVRPPSLKGEAAKIWTRLMPLIPTGVLTKDTGQTLARYCHGLVRWWKLATWLDGNEDTYEVVDQAGNTRFVRHPNVITYEKLG